MPSGEAGPLMRRFSERSTKTPCACVMALAPRARIKDKTSIVWGLSLRITVVLLNNFFKAFCQIRLLFIFYR